MSPNPTTITNTPNTTTISNIQTESKKDSFSTTIKDYFNKAKKFILTHKSALAQGLGAASIAFGGVVLSAMGCAPAGIPLLILGGLLFVAGTGGVIHKKNVEGKAQGLTSKEITYNIVKTSLKNSFLGVVIGGILGFGISGAAAIPFLADLRQKREDLDTVFVELKDTRNALNDLTDKAFKIQQEEKTATNIPDTLKCPNSSNTATNDSSSIDNNIDNDEVIDDVDDTRIPDSGPSDLELDRINQNLVNEILNED
ncbi:MAG: hypothetical protein ACLRFH_02035 [Opitutales bacterium]